MYLKSIIERIMKHITYFSQMGRTLPLKNQYIYTKWKLMQRAFLSSMNVFSDC